MAKKRVATGPRRRHRGSGDQTDHECLQDAADALDRARDAVRQAEVVYQRAVQRSTSHDEAESEALTVGDVLDAALEFARRHPAPALVAAGLVGFLLGRSVSR